MGGRGKGGTGIVNVCMLDSKTHIAANATQVASAATGSCDETLASIAHRRSKTARLYAKPLPCAGLMHCALLCPVIVNP